MTESNVITIQESEELLAHDRGILRFLCGFTE